MQPIKILLHWLENNASDTHYLFVLQDLRGLLPNLNDTAFKTLMSRIVALGYLDRVCRGLYAYKPSEFAHGLLLFHTAAYLRSNDFNYISLETVLSDAGVISQIPINYVSIMSSGRSNKISCGRFGTIEFVHTEQKPTDLIGQLVYDGECRLWRAMVPLALKDMKRTRRTTSNLIDWDVVDEIQIT